MKNWRESLAEPPENDVAFRFQQPFVPVSSIAEQYYCEAKVEQEYTHGEIPSEVKDVGTELHGEVFAMEEVKLDDLIEHIESTPHLTASFGLHGKIGELDVVGTPDAVVFEKARPRWVIELKTTRGDPSRLWTEHVVQVRIYGILMERMGFECSKLELALVRWRQEDLTDFKRKEMMLSRITRSLFYGRTKNLEAKLGMKFFIFPHEAHEAEKAVAWAQGFWLGKREPIPTENPAKCRACEYNDMCPHNLFKPGQKRRTSCDSGRI